MPAWDMWRSRSILMKITSFLMTGSVCIHAFSLVSSHWAKNKQGAAIGLWTYVISNTTAPVAAVPVVYPTFGVLSTLILMCALTINILLLHKNALLVMPAMIVFSFLAGCMQIVLVVLWALPHLEQEDQYGVSFTFWTACAAMFLDVTCGFLCVLEFVRQKHLGMPLFRGLHRPLATEEPDDITQVRHTESERF